MKGLMQKHRIAIVLLFFLFATSKASSDVEGVPSVTDGDTLRFGDTRVRLFGIDAPESKQTCERDGVTWLCGQEAGKVLRDLVGSQPLTCDEMDRDRYGRSVAVCVLPDGRDIGAIMVSEGLALDYAQYSKGMYAIEEREAREAGRGMWAGTFTPPWEWRRKR